MANLKLTTSRYTQPGAYVGEILNPATTNLSADARIPAIIAKGSRLAVANNVSIIRAFIQAAPLSFSSAPPYIAPLAHAATGAQSLPNRIFKQDGTQLRLEEWQYIKTNGVYSSVQIRNESFDTLATYYMDYQSSDRNVQDPIPLADIRQLRAVGNQLNSAQYKEYQDFFVPCSFTNTSGDVDNVHTTGFFSPVTGTLQTGSTGTLTVPSNASYQHAYSRQYQLVCLGAAGAPGLRTAAFQWSSTPISGGNAVQPPVPLNSADTAPTFLVDENNPASMTPVLEYGVTLNFNFGAANFASGDTFVVTANGPSLVEIDTRYQSPQFATVQTPVAASGTANDLTLAVNPATNYTNARNNQFMLKLIDLVGSTPSRILTFAWARYGDVLPVTGWFTIQENILSSLTQTLWDGVQIDFLIGPTSPVIGATWTVQAQAPRIFYTAKDAREYTLNLQTPVTTGTVVTLNGGFSTTTTEGRFGTFSAQFDFSGPTPHDGYAVLPDNVSLAFRNMAASFANLDIFTFGVSDLGVMDWSLKALTQDIRELTDYQTDMNGQITDMAGQQYVTLTLTPTDQNSIHVINYNTGAEISFNWALGTPFIYFSTAPGVPIKISYTSIGKEPDPGQTYYITTLFLRPTALYNVPFLVLRLEDGRNYAAPSAIDNDLYIGNEIAWANNAPGVYLVQPLNVDGSGVYSLPDFVTAIDSIVNYPRITDLCLLNYPAGLAEVLNQNVIANDPFEQRPNLVWVGMPIGTPIGDENTDGSMVQMATRTLQVTGDSDAHGTRIMVGSTQATKTIVLDGGLSASVTLDGSFIALAGAARVASFKDPATDILGTLISGFDTIEVLRNDQIALLGAAQILYVKGDSSAYTWGEDYTVDSASGFNLIQLMTQRCYVTQVVVREMSTLVGTVPASASAAKQLVQGKLASILTGLLARGLLGQYQDANGNDRLFDPNLDIIVFEDQNDATLFYFNYAWYSRNVIKRLFGLYNLNSNDFSTGVALQ